MATKLEMVLDSLTELNRRIDRLKAREDKARADSEAAARAIHERRGYEDRQRRQMRFARFQSRVDDVLERYGLRAPAPVAGMGAREYKLSLLQLCQDQLPPENELARVHLSRCDDDAVDVLSHQIIDAAKALAYDRSTVPSGKLKERTMVDANGLRQTIFVGDEAANFVHDFSLPGRRARIIDPDLIRARSNGRLNLGGLWN